MPVYRYRCNQCGTDFDKAQPITSPSMATCPTCGHVTHHRLIQKIGGVIFKGSGWPSKDISRKENE